MTWMLSKDEDGWQIVERESGRLVQKVVWLPRRRVWSCGCGSGQCRHRQMLELLGVCPPLDPPGRVAEGTTFDPLTQKGY